MALSDELAKLQDLHQRGALSDEEFTRAKARLLDDSAAQTKPPMPSTALAAINALRRSAAIAGSRVCAAASPAPPAWNPGSSACCSPFCCCAAAPDWCSMRCCGFSYRASSAISGVESRCYG